MSQTTRRAPTCPPRTRPRTRQRTPQRTRAHAPPRAATRTRAVRGLLVVCGWTATLATLATQVALAHAPAASASRRCHVPRVDLGAVEAALARAARRPRARHPSRWWALLPARVGLRGRTGTRAGAGLYLAPDDLIPSERWLTSARRSGALTIGWDLRPLWATRAPREPALAAHALAVDRVTQRVAESVVAAEQAAAAARALPWGDPACRRLQILGVAARLRLRAVVAALSPGRRWPSSRRAPRRAAPRPPGRATLR